MPGPALSPDEIAQLTKDQAKATAAAATFTAAIAAQQAQAAQYAVSDGAFKKFFDYYNDSIIGQYDAERKALNGYTLTSPVVEADIVSCASLAGGRIQPTLPATDIVRISQFDGTPFTVAPDNELQHISDQANLETVLVTGYGGTAPGSGVTTATAITPASTTLQLTSATSFSITPNSTYVVTSGSDLAVVKILTFVMEPNVIPAPFIADCTIQIIVAPTASVSSGQQLLAFNGFTNAERTTKTATVNPSLQSLMTYLVAQLQAAINGRLGNLTAELTALAANQDPEPGTEISTATTNVNASKSFLTNYLITTTITDFGLNQLSTERTGRTTDANARITQITNAYTSRSKNYYNERYNAANNRANTSRGSLRIQKSAEQAGAASAGFASTLGAQASAISSILP